MAHFRGTVQGDGRGEASRLGHKKTGLTVRASTWTEDVVTRLWVKDDVDMVDIIMESNNSMWIVYSGPLKEFAALGRPGFIRKVAHEAVQSEFNKEQG